MLLKTWLPNLLSGGEIHPTALTKFLLKVDLCPLHVTVVIANAGEEFQVLMFQHAVGVLAFVLLLLLHFFFCILVLWEYVSQPES